MACLLAASAAADAPERIETDWILRYEQAYGVAGLYVAEAPGDDEAARTRRVLVELTLAAREVLARSPEVEPTVESLVRAGLITEAPQPPEGGSFVFNREARRFTTTLGGPHDLVFGAARQIAAMDGYLRVVAQGSPSLRERWRVLADDPTAPQLVRREIEARLYAIENADPPNIEMLVQVQRLLGQLNAAIELAVASRLLEPGAEIAMEDVGNTGLIQMLEALPGGGQYEVSRVGEPPVAVYGETRVAFDPGMVDRVRRQHFESLLEARPSYPPAMAMAARAREAEEALELLDRAVALWPDVPALRVQRISVLAAMLRVEELAEDLDWLLARFPAAPVLIEVLTATRQGPLAQAADARADVASAVARVRPEVLPLQVAAIREALLAERFDEAREVRDRVVGMHPGFEPLLALPEGD